MKQWCIGGRQVMRGVSLAAAVLWLSVPLGGLAAEELNVTYGIDTYSHYVWRGITLTNDPVVQPSVKLSYGSGFSLEVWGNIDVGEENDNEFDLNEIDLTAEYAWELGGWDLAVGFIEYTFPNAIFPGTREVYGSVAWSGLVTPSLALYYDLDEIEDLYASLGVEHTRELGERWDLTVAASAGYAGPDFAIGRQEGWHDGNVSLSISHSRSILTMALDVAFTDSLDDSVLLDQPVGFWGGLRIGLDF